MPMDDSTKIELREYLYKHITEKKPKVCVEVGTHRGVTALYIASALAKNGEGILYTVDPTDYGFHQTLKQFTNLAPFVIYKPIRGIDLQVEDIDFIFIDGFHEYEAVRDEIVYFLPRLSKGAHVLFHDCGGDNEFVGVNKAIDSAGLKAEIIDFGGSKSRLYIHEDLSHNA